MSTIETRVRVKYMKMATVHVGINVSTLFFMFDTLQFTLFPHSIVLKTINTLQHTFQ